MFVTVETIKEPLVFNLRGLKATNLNKAWGRSPCVSWAPPTGRNYFVTILEVETESFLPLFFPDDPAGRRDAQHGQQHDAGGWAGSVDGSAGSHGLFPHRLLPPEDRRLPAGHGPGLLSGQSSGVCSVSPPNWFQLCFFLTSVSPPQTSPNIALEAHAVRAADWNGMTCMLFQRPSPERTHGQDRQLTFKCNTTSSFSSILVKVSSAHSSQSSDVVTISWCVIEATLHTDVNKVNL